VQRSFLDIIHEEMMQRPTGITILAVLAVIGGLMGIIGAFGLFSLGALSGALLGAAGVAGAGFLVGGFAVFWGLVTLVQSVLSLAFGYGAWFLKPWAWMLGVGVEGVSIFVAFINWIGGNSDFFGFLISAAIAGVILYYLFSAEIKRVFGRT
jgi:hypothetical protein